MERSGQERSEEGGASGAGSTVPAGDASAASAGDAPGGAGPAFPASRRRLFAAITLSVPVLLFLGLEASLRLVGFGSGYPLFIEAETSDRYLRMNPRVGHRFFVGDAIVPGVTRDVFRAEKAPATLRLVVQGGSTALGYPYFYGGAFPRMLERRLQDAFPERRIEVVNTAMTAVNSYTLLDFADEIVEIHPDAVLIYAGHNEYYGALGVGSSQSVGRWRPFVRAYVALRRLRTVQLVRAGLAWARDRLRQGPAPSPRTQMERLVGERTIPYGSLLYERGIEQFRRNLETLLERYARAEVPVFVATLVSNERDQPPFISGHDPRVTIGEWEEAATEALTAVERGDAEPARARLGRLAARDSSNAEAFYRAARRLDRAGALPLARRLYLGAKDRDMLRFRAPEAMNAAVRSAARRWGAWLVDVQAAFATASPAGIPGSTLITEHLHPRLSGYAVLADAFYEALERAELIPAGEPGAARPGGPSEAAEAVPDEATTGARPDRPYTAVDSIYGELQVRALTAGWPFRSDPDEERRILAELRSEPEGPPPARIAHALYHRRITWPEAMRALYGHYQASGEFDRSIHVARALAQEYPDLAAPHQLWATAALRAGAPDEAVRAAREADDLEPSHRTAAMLGSALLAAGNREAALRALERAARLAPADEPVPAAALAAARALPELESRAAERPTDPAALYELADAYAALNHVRRAREMLERLLQIDPTHAAGRRLEERLAPSRPGAEGPPPASEPWRDGRG